MGALISLFHNKLDELKETLPLFGITPVEAKFVLNGKEEKFLYEAHLSDETALYFNYTDKEVSELKYLHKLAKDILEFNSNHTNLKVFIEEPNIVWIDYDFLRSPVFTDFADYSNESGKQKFKELNEKAEIIKKDNTFFICSHCHTLKHKSFLFNTVISGNTCVACIEVDDETSYS